MYQKPFCLPFAFRYRKSDIVRSDKRNPFEYQNDLYQQLTGEDIQLYQPIPYQTSGAAVSVSDVQFYVLDLDCMAQAAQKIKKCSRGNTNRGWICNIAGGSCKSFGTFVFVNSI